MGSAPNPDTAECECPNNQIPSVDGTKCQCPNGQGLVDGSDDCVDCGTVLEGSAPDPDTAECECPEGQIPSVDGTKCEDDSTGVPLPDDVCEIGQGLVDGQCKNCSETGRDPLITSALTVAPSWRAL